MEKKNRKRKEKGNPNRRPTPFPPAQTPLRPSSPSPHSTARSATSPLTTRGPSKPPAHAPLLRSLHACTCEPSRCHMGPTHQPLLPHCSSTRSPDHPHPPTFADSSGPLVGPVSFLSPSPRRASAPTTRLAPLRRGPDRTTRSRNPPGQPPSALNPLEVSPPSQDHTDLLA